jgi:flagellin-like hook-associated protein FlgL
MSTGFSLQQTTARMGNYYNATMSALSTSLTRLASGKNYNKPSDGVIEYMRVDSVQRSTRDFETIHRQLGEGLDMARQAETIGMSIVDNIQEMKKAAMDYWLATDPQERASHQATFDGLRTVVDSLINASAYFGRDMMQTGTVSSVNISLDDPAQVLKLELDADDIVSTAGLNVNLGSEAATIAELDTQLGRALSYLSKDSGYLHSLEAQESVTLTMIDNGNMFEQNLNGVDIVSEMNNVTARDIRQQAALSMIAQGNMYRMGVLKLIDF